MRLILILLIAYMPQLTLIWIISKEWSGLCEEAEASGICGMMPNESKVVSVSGLQYQWAHYPEDLHTEDKHDHLDDHFEQVTLCYTIASWITDYEHCIMVVTVEGKAAAFRQELANSPKHDHVTELVESIHRGVSPLPSCMAGQSCGLGTKGYCHCHCLQA